MKEPSKLLDVAVAAALVAALVAAAWFLREPDIVGAVRVVDGDTLAFGSRRVRLVGIDAPELDQTCDRGGASVACGREARDALRQVVGREAVACRPQGRDRYGRDLAVCHVAGQDVGEAMVARGLALSLGPYGRAEEAARGARLGIWAGRFEAPSDWRRRKAVAESGPPGAPPHRQAFE